MKHESTLRVRFDEQNGKCFYCERDTWLPAEGKKNACVRLGMPITGHGCVINVQRRMATREHLHRKADGGPDKLENYVMACRKCNKSRGGRKVEDHKALIMARASGKESILQAER